MIVADDGYKILDVFVDGESVGAISSYTFSEVLAPHTLEAVFEKVLEYHTLVSNVQGGGQIEPVGLQEVIGGGTVSYQILADEGYHLRNVLVDGVSVGKVDEYVFSDITTSHEILAVFEKTRLIYDVVASSSKGGVISPAGVSKVQANGEIEYTFEAEEGYHLIQIVVDGQPIRGASSFVFSQVNENHEIVAEFQKTRGRYFISLDNQEQDADEDEGEGGTEEQEGVASGSDKNYEIIADEGYELQDILLNGTSALDFQSPHFGLTPLEGTNNSSTKARKMDLDQGVLLSLTDIKEDINITIKQAKKKPSYDLVTEIKGEGHIAAVLPKKVLRDSSISFSVKADEGYHLSNVIINGKKMDPIQHILIPKVSSDNYIEIYFEEKSNFYQIKGGTIGSGEISPSGVQEIELGDDISYIFAPSAGFLLTDILINGISMKSKEGAILSNAFVFRKVMSNQEIVGVFSKREATYQIIALSNEGGRLSKLGTTNVPEGDTYVCRIVANPGYRIADVILDDNSLGSVSVVQINSVDLHHSLNVVFEKSSDTYTVNVSAGEGGSVTPSGIRTVGAGESFLLEIEPAEGYRVLSVFVNGKSVSAKDKLLIKEVYSNYNISVTFVSEDGVYIISERLVGGGYAKVIREVAVNAGDSFVSAYEVPEGLKLVDILLDGVSQGELLSYTFANVDSDHVLTYIVEADLKKRLEIAEEAVANAGKVDDTTNNNGNQDIGGSKGSSGCQYNMDAPKEAPWEFLVLLFSVLGVTRLIRRRIQKNETNRE